MTTIKTLSNELKKLQNEYKKAKADHEMIKKIEREAKTKVLNENVFFTCAEHLDGEKESRITDPSEDFLMSDKDFEKYCKLTYLEYNNRGLDVPDWNTTPDYKTFKNLQNAENKLIDFAMMTAPSHLREEMKKVSKHWKYRNEFLELVLKLDLSK